MKDVFCLSNNMGSTVGSENRWKVSKIAKIMLRRSSRVLNAPNRVGKISTASRWIASGHFGATFESVTLKQPCLPESVSLCSDPDSPFIFSLRETLEETRTTVRLVNM